MNASVKYRIFLFLLVGLAPAALGAQEKKNADFPEIRATVNPAKATVGAPLEYRLLIAGKSAKDVAIRMPDNRVVYPEPDAEKKKDEDDKSGPKEDASLKVPLYVIQGAKKDQSKSGDIAQISVTMKLAYFRPGKHRLPEIELFGVDNIKIGYRVPEVEIESVNPAGEFAEIEPPLELSGNYWRVIWIVLALAAAAAGGWWFARWHNRRKLGSPAIVPVNHLEEFLRGVGNISRRKLIESENVREYVFEISALFRKFLEGSLGIYALDMTVTEIHRALRENLHGAVYKRNEDDIRSVLDLWDLAKFAEFAPSRETLKLNLEASVRLAKNLAGSVGDVVA